MGSSAVGLSSLLFLFGMAGSSYGKLEALMEFPSDLVFAHSFVHRRFAEREDLSGERERNHSVTSGAYSIGRGTWSGQCPKNYGRGEN